MDPLMKYSGKHVFHFTKFETALRIIATKSLKFGHFENMNDIAEAKRDVYGMISSNTIKKELSKYQSISLTLDKVSHRGFYNDPLWGHYAQCGNGVCLVFDSNKLSQNFIEQFGEQAKIAPIVYLSEHTNAVFTEGESQKAIEQYIEDNLTEIFFTKSLDWKYEQELRLLIKVNETKENYLYWNDALIATIICLPQIYDYKKAPEFIILKSILNEIPILHYTTSLGNKSLLNEDGEKVCDIPGDDLEILYE